MDAAMSVISLTMTGFTGTWDTQSFAFSIASGTLLKGTFLARNSIITSGFDFNYETGATFTAGHSTLIMTQTSALKTCGQTSACSLWNLTIASGRTITIYDDTTIGSLDEVPGKNQAAHLELNGILVASGDVTLRLLGAPYPLILGPTASISGANRIFFRTIDSLTIHVPGGIYPEIFFRPFTGDNASFIFDGDVTAQDVYAFNDNSGSFLGSIIDTNGKAFTVKNLYLGKAAENRFGAVRARGSTVIINGELVIHRGSEAASSSFLDMGGSDFTVKGNISNDSNSTLWRGGTSTLRLPSTFIQAVFGNGSKSLFYNVVLSGAAEKDFETNFTTNRVILSGAALTMRITHDYFTWTIHAGASIRGVSSGVKLSLRGADASTFWNLDAEGSDYTVRASYVDVQRSDASGGAAIDAADNTDVDSGNNVNWVFPGGAITYRYAVGLPCNWSSTSCWSVSPGGAGGASVPTSTTNVALDENSGVGTLTIDMDPTVRAMYSFGFTETLSINSHFLTVSGNILHEGGKITISTGRLDGPMTSSALLECTGGNPCLVTSTDLTVAGSILDIDAGSLQVSDSLNLQSGGGIWIGPGSLYVDGPSTIDDTGYLKLGSSQDIQFNSTYTSSSRSSSWEADTSRVRFASSTNATFTYAGLDLGEPEFYDLDFHSKATAKRVYQESNSVWVANVYRVIDDGSSCSSWTSDCTRIDLGGTAHDVGTFQVTTGGVVNMNDGATILVRRAWDSHNGTIEAVFSNVVFTDDSTIRTSNPLQTIGYDVTINLGVTVRYWFGFDVLDRLTVNGVLKNGDSINNPLLPVSVEGFGGTFGGPTTDHPLIIGPSGDISQTGMFRYLLVWNIGNPYYVAAGTYHYLDIPAGNGANVHLAGNVVTSCGATVIFYLCAMLIAGWVPDYTFDFYTDNHSMNIAGILWIGDVSNRSSIFHAGSSQIIAHGIQVKEFSTAYFENANVTSFELFGQGSQPGYSQQGGPKVHAGNATFTIHGDFFFYDPAEEAYADSALYAEQSTWIIDGWVVIRGPSSFLQLGSSNWNIGGHIDPSKHGSLPYEGIWYSESTSTSWSAGQSTVRIQSHKSANLNSAGFSLVGPEFNNLILDSNSTFTVVYSLKDLGPIAGGLWTRNLTLQGTVGAAVFKNPIAAPIEIDLGLSIRSGGALDIAKTSLSGAFSVTAIPGNVALSYAGDWTRISATGAFLKLNGSSLGLSLSMSSGPTTGTLRHLGTLADSPALDFRIDSGAGNLVISLGSVPTSAIVLSVDGVEFERTTARFPAPVIFTYSGPWSAHDFELNGEPLKVSDFIDIVAVFELFAFIGAVTLLLVFAWGMKKRRGV